MISEGSFVIKEVSFFIKEPSEMFLFDHLPESVSTNSKTPVPQQDRWDAVAADVIRLIILQSVLDG
jgi:hypothetical protein